MALCFGALLWWGAQSAGAQTRRSVTNLYRDLCASCHGANMEGGQTPSLLDDTWRFGSDDGSLARVIRDGLPENGMPALGAAFSAAEIRAMVIYMREKGAQAALRASPPPRPLGGQVVPSLKHRFRLEGVASNLSTPWSMAFLPDGRLLFTELPGTLRWVNGGGGVSAPVHGVPPVRAQGQGGLLGLAVDGDEIYLSYSDLASNARGANVGMTALMKGKLVGNTLVDTVTLFKAPAELYLPSTVHFGSRIVLDGRGHVYFSVGERGSGEDAQRLDRPNGKIHRLNTDGSIPADNPFVGQSNAFPSIYSYGHRNPQGLALRPGGGQLYSTEHGPRGGDELNLILAASNYGWPRVTYGMNYNGTPITDKTSAPGLTGPLIHWTPSIAVCGMAFMGRSQGSLPSHSTQMVFVGWAGNLFVTALAQEELRRLELDGPGNRVLAQEVLFRGLGRVRDVCVGPDGLVYVAFNKPDQIARLVPVGEP